MPTDPEPYPNVDRRLWWQKLADGIADGICAVLRLFGRLFHAWPWWHHREPFDP
jgi:hypothetical protein